MNIDQLHVPLVEVGPDLVVTHVNPALEALVGVGAEHIEGRNVFDALRPRLLDGQNLMERGWHPSVALRGTHRLPETEVLVRADDGAEVEAMLDGRYLRDADGKLTGAVFALRKRHRGRRKPRSAIRIVSAVSHELRTPLTSVRGFTSLLLKKWDDISDDDRREMLTQIDRDARRISRMIGELLDISRLETGHLNLNWTLVDFERIATSVVETVRLSWPDLEAEVDFQPGFPQTLADADKVSQVLTNLVENACKYASPKGIDVRGTFDDDAIRVEVCDRGPGIPSADLAGLFRQFFRSTQGRPTGTGLGLWISRGLIESHGGKLVATSLSAEEASPGERTGTTFTFTIPRRNEIPGGRV